LWLKRRPERPASVETARVVAAVQSADPLPAKAAVVRMGTRFYVVRRGDSLWSIASDLLAGKARPAAVARAVARLWRLNRGRIGTDDPSVLPVGVRLRLK
jgi:Tfp pilus assembly protein FimV